MAGVVTMARTCSLIRRHKRLRVAEELTKDILCASNQANGGTPVIPAVRRFYVENPIATNESQVDALLSCINS